MAVQRLFGTDGIRGIANSERMNSELGLAVGRAAAYFARKTDELPKIVIGKDTRLSGYMLETALAAGITSMGLNVVKTGPLPTPGVAFICRSMRARLGIVISASHNPASENGIKIFNEEGFKLAPFEEREIEELVGRNIPSKHIAKPEGVGKILQVHDAAGRYVQYLKERFPHGMTLKGVKVAVDTANGAAYRVAPLVFSELGADVAIINSNPTGHNINAGCGSLHPDVICRFAKDVKADVGITLDGDADRVLLSDEFGNLVDGDGILYILAKHFHAEGKLDGKAVVGTVMSNYGLDAALKKEGIPLARADVGDQNVISYMKENGLILGGEPSGHIIHLGQSSTGDGILAALRVLAVMIRSKKPLSALVKPYKPFPQRTINVGVRKKVPFEKIGELAKTKAGADKRLKGIGRTLIRYSGTEMIARITVESNQAKLTNEIVEGLAEVVSRHLG